MSTVLSATETLVLRGTDVTEQPISPKLATAIAAHSGLTKERSVRVSDASRGGGGPVEVRLGREQLVAVETSDGRMLWFCAADFLDWQGIKADRQADLTVLLAPANDARGLGDWFVEAFHFLIGEAVEKAAVALLESKLLAANKLFRVVPRSAAGPASRLLPFKASALDADKPWLLLLHGTQSSSSGSFAQLMDSRKPTDTWGVHGVLGFEHRTLSESPIRNVLDLAKQLPDGADLLVIGFSRGGLVGELLARACEPDAIREIDIAHFAALSAVEWPDPDQHEQEVAALRALLRAVRKKRLSVRLHIPVGAPLRGTSLADGRLSRFLSQLLNIGALGSFVLDVAWQGVLLKLLTTVAQDLLDFTDLPGLQAMHPRGALVRWLNSLKASGPVAALSATAGDESWRAFGSFVMDQVFPGANDWVVDTAAMLPIVAPALASEPATRLVLKLDVSAPALNHLSYFADNRVQLALYETVTLAAKGDVPDFIALQANGFVRVLGDSEIARRRAARQARSRQPSAAGENAPALFLLPGIMGTELIVERNVVWLDLPELLILGGMSKLRRTATDGVVIGEPLADWYGDLAQFLARDHQVIPFGFDWRHAIGDSAVRLNEAVRVQLLAKPQRPIRFLAHSMGGLVVRAMMSLPNSVWPQLSNNEQTRVLMLGTPNRGSHAVSQIITGTEDVLRKLAWGASSLHDLVGYCADFPGSLDMLPDFVSEQANSSHALFERKFWGTLLAKAGVELPLPANAAFKRAAAFRARLQNQQLDPKRVFYVAGKAEKTPFNVTTEDGWFGRQRIVFQNTSDGDGRVTWAHGIPPMLKSWVVDAAHGDLPKTESAFQGYLDILQTGDTSSTQLRVSSTRGMRGGVTSGAPSGTSLGAKRAILPDRNALEAAALGASGPAPARATRAPRPRVLLRVSCGDVRSADFPVMVGHYRDDGLYSAEKAIDLALDGEIAKSLALGTHPNELGQCKVFLRAKRHTNATVIGLGEFGLLSTGRLVDTLAQGITCWIEAKLQTGASNAQQLSFSAVLIGTGTGGVGVEPALQALLEALSRAGDRHEAALRQNQPKTSQPMLPAVVEVIELYSDRAHRAWHTLHALCSSPSYQAQFSLSGPLVVRSTSRRRAYFDEDRDWAQRIRIEGIKDSLRFTVYAGLARVEGRTVSVNAELSGTLVEKSSALSRDAAQVSVALYHQLVPREIKEATPTAERLVLIVDREAARVPWELLRENSEQVRGKPLSVQGGMVRQLSVDTPPQILRRVRNNQALVLGDPKLSERFKRDFSQLGGAAEEATAIHNLLQAKGFKVSGANQLSSPEISILLFSERYQVLHLAGHGVDNFELDGQFHAGMVLENGFFEPADIEKLPGAPELVFINCCHLGSIGRAVNLPKLAANLAEQFIKLGASAVVAAGWAVDDGAAKRFAEVFYEAMLSGRKFIDAVREARSRVFEEYPQDNTWGAYQCYGASDYRLRSQARGNATGAKYASPRDLVLTLIEPATQEVRRASLGKARLHAVQVHAAVKETRYANTRAVQAALAEFNFHAGLFEESIENCKQALLRGGSTGQLRLLTRSVAAAGRAAVQPGLSGAQAQMLLNSAQLAMGLLHALPKTRSRATTLAAFAKRKAFTSKAPADLDLAAAAYRLAIQQSGHPCTAEHASNQWAFLTLCRYWQGATLTPEESLQLAALTGARCKRLKQTARFWRASARADRLLLQFLAQAAGLSGASPPSAQAIAKAADRYAHTLLTALSADPGTEHWLSALEILDFLDGFALGQLAAVIEVLEHFRQPLEIRLAKLGLR